MNAPATSPRSTSRGLRDRAGASHDTSGIEQEVLALFDKFRDPLLRYVGAFGISIGDAKTLIQDVFLALFRHLRDGGGRSNLQGWLFFESAHNLALKRRARERRERDRFRADGHAACLLLNPDTIRRSSSADREHRKRAMAVLNALPERDRQCVSLRGHGLRYREIAQVLSISLGAVAKSLTRSVARLQRATEG